MDRIQHQTNRAIEQGTDKSNQIKLHDKERHRFVRHQSKKQNRTLLYID